MNLKDYRIIQEFDISEYLPTPKQIREIQTILDIAKDWTQNYAEDTPWDISGAHNKAFGEACRNASIGAQWTMINAIRQIDKEMIEVGDEGFAANHDVIDHKLLNKVENISKQSVAERYASYIDTLEEALGSSAYKNKKVDKKECWHIGNQFAEVMGVKMPNPEYWANAKKPKITRANYFK